MVLEASTGQNALAQARLFHEAVGLTGLVLTKLDGTAKGGIVVRIYRELGVPIKLIGVGEQVEDLEVALRLSGWAQCWADPLEAPVEVDEGSVLL